MKRTFTYLSFAALALISLNACQKEWSADIESATVYESIEFSISDDHVRAKIYTDNTGSLTLPMVAGESITIGYTTSPEASEVTIPDISWTSSDESVATVDDGIITAVSEGSAIITVQPSTMNLIATASLRVNVVNTAVQVTSITITDNATMTDENYGLPSCYMGETMQLTATVQPEDATYQTVYWSSADDRIATVDPVSGVVTGVSQGRVGIVANSLDDGRVSSTHEIYIDQIVTPIGIALPDNGIRNTYSIDEKSCTIEFDTYPELATKSLLTWTSSDETVATVDGGVVTFKSYGSVTITVTCPDGYEDAPDGYSKSLNISIAIPAGYYNETFRNETTEWALNSSHVSSGATMVKQYNSSTDEYYWLVTPYLSGTTGRGDIQHNGSSLYLDPAAYPILCFRIDDVNDAANGGYSRNITIDTSGKDLSGNAFSGGINGNNQRWKTKYSCSDNSSILVYDLSSQEFATGGLLTSIGTFGTFQVKYADIKEVTDASKATYRYFWFLTFADEAEMEAYLAEWSTRTGITY